MKRSIVLLVMFTLLLQMPLTYANEPAVFSLQASLQQAAEGDTVKLSVYVNVTEGITEGYVKLDLPEGVFTENTAETEIDLQNLQISGGSALIANFNLQLKTVVLDGHENEKAIDVSINSDTYIKCNETSCYAAEGITQSLTIVPVLLTGEVTAYCRMEGASGICAMLKEKADPSADDINLDLKLEQGKLIFSVRKSSLKPEAAYTVFVSGSGFISASADLNLGGKTIVDGFYPGDVNESGEEIDIYDFNLLCYCILNNKNEDEADLNRDLTVDKKDIACFTAGYNAKKAGEQND